jgi:alcohol dehydrogenase YqhD (iron-dependent ADH family)
MKAVWGEPLWLLPFLVEQQLEQQEGVKLMTMQTIIENGCACMEDRTMDETQSLIWLAAAVRNSELLENWMGWFSA